LLSAALGVISSPCGTEQRFARCRSEFFEPRAFFGGESSIVLTSLQRIGTSRPVALARPQSLHVPAAPDNLLAGRSRPAAIVDQLDLSPAAMAFLFDAPPLAGSQQASNAGTPTQDAWARESSARDSSVSDAESRVTESQEGARLGGEARVTDSATGGEGAAVEGAAEGAATVTASSETQEDRSADDRVEGKEGEEKGGEEEEEVAEGAGNAGLTAEEQEQVKKLAERDREVRTHEQAHVAAAGPYLRGGPTYTYQKGPDGKNYAVGGEVQIDNSPVPNDPEATIRKAHVVRAAALAPAEPSAQDRAVAAAATKMQQEAQAEVLQMRIAESTNSDREGSEEGSPAQAQAKGNANGNGMGMGKESSAAGTSAQESASPAQVSPRAIDPGISRTGISRTGISRAGDSRAGDSQTARRGNLLDVRW